VLDDKRRGQHDVRTSAQVNPADRSHLHKRKW
jgi:hypothetical protein